MRRSTVQRLPLSVSVPCPNVFRTFFGNVRLIANAMRTFIVFFLKVRRPTQTQDFLDKFSEYHPRVLYYKAFKGCK